MFPKLSICVSEKCLSPLVTSLGTVPAEQLCVFLLEQHWTSGSRGFHLYAPVAVSQPVLNTLLCTATQMLAPAAAWYHLTLVLHVLRSGDSDHANFII